MLIFNFENLSIEVNIQRVEITIENNFHLPKRE